MGLLYLYHAYRPTVGPGQTCIPLVGSIAVQCRSVRLARVPRLPGSRRWTLVVGCYHASSSSALVALCLVPLSDLPCEVCRVGYGTVWSGKTLTPFGRNTLPPAAVEVACFSETLLSLYWTTSCHSGFYSRDGGSKFLRKVCTSFKLHGVAFQETGFSYSPQMSPQLTSSVR
jgi:hypothetical protein